MIRFFIILCIAFLLGCTKDNQSTDPIDNDLESLSLLQTPDDEYRMAMSIIKANPVMGSRNGLLLPILHMESLTIDNFLLSGSPNYRNVQYLFNKDSVAMVTMDRVSDDIVNIYGKWHGVFMIKIDFKSANFADFIITVYAIDSQDAKMMQNKYTFKPSGTNYGAGINHQLRYERDTQTLRYYDTSFRTYKTKYRYTVMASGVIYRDFIPSTIRGSNVFRLDHVP